MIIVFTVLYRRVVEELIATEEVYVQDLKLIVEVSVLLSNINNIHVYYYY